MSLAAWILRIKYSHPYNQPALPWHSSLRACTEMLCSRETLRAAHSFDPPPQGCYTKAGWSRAHRQTPSAPPRPSSVEPSQCLVLVGLQEPQVCQNRTCFLPSHCPKSLPSHSSSSSWAAASSGVSEAIFSASAHVLCAHDSENRVLFPKPCYMSSTHIGKYSGKSPKINTPSAPGEQSIANLLQLTQGGKQTENTTSQMKIIFQGPRHLRHSLTLLEYEYMQIISSILQNQVLLEPRLKEHPNQIPD